MIHTLQALAARGDFDVSRFGEKAAHLARLLRDSNVHSFDIVPPSGTVVETGRVDESALREAYSDVSSKLRESGNVGALICRSSGVGELPGANQSIVVGYNPEDVAGSWRSFREAFETVHNQHDGIPVLLQQLVGDVSVYRRTRLKDVDTFEWPGLPIRDRPHDFTEEESRELFLELTNHVKDILTIASSSGEVSIGPTGQESIIQFDLNENDLYAHSTMVSILDNRLLDCRWHIDSNGSIVDGVGNVILGQGDSAVIRIPESIEEPIVGVRNTGFSARSHSFEQSGLASVKKVIGLTRSLMDRPPGSDLFPMRVEYFNLATSALREDLDLGTDYRETSFRQEYRQKSIDVFSLDTNGIRKVPFRNFPRAPARTPHELLHLLRFYNQEFGVEVEIEGCITEDGLHIVQIAESRLPSEVLSSFSNVPYDKVLYGTEGGRGAINYRGNVVLVHPEASDRDFSSLDQLVVGFNEAVTQAKNFVYLASNGSIVQDIIRRTRGQKKTMGRISEHMAGIAAQTVVNAAHFGSQGGVFWIGNPLSTFHAIAQRANAEEHPLGYMIREVGVEAIGSSLMLYSL